jgi:hypothetical protein
MLRGNDLKKITTLEMEVELANYLNHRVNIVVPNVSWGMFSHECDLVRLTPAGYCSEIEIKVSLSDLKKDKEKRHNHMDGGVYGYGTNKIKYLYFAIPEYLEPHIGHIPERAGILVAREYSDYYDNDLSKIRIEEIRAPQKQCNYKFSEKERIKLLSLMAMRIWGLKRKLAKCNSQQKQ